MDGNTSFTSDKGGIVNLCQEYQLQDPLDHIFGDMIDTKT